MICVRGKNIIRGHQSRGFRRRDYALRNAAWHVTDIFAELREDEDRRDGFLDPLSILRDASDEKADVGTPQEAATDGARIWLPLPA